MSDIASGFQDADGSMEGDLLHCLDFMNGLPFFRSYKEATWKALRIAGKSRILDVACGAGFDSIEIARIYPQCDVVGVDISKRFLEIAKSRAKDLPNAVFVQGRADHLEFEDNAFDAVRIDRSLQHIHAPINAIREMVRVTRPGGRIVVAEPDWGTYFVYNGDLDTGAKMARFWLQSFVNPYIGREAGALLAAQGVTEISCRVHALAARRLDEATIIFDLDRVTENCVKSGALSGTEATDWRARSEAASRNETFLACLNIFEFDGGVAK